MAAADRRRCALYCVCDDCAATTTRRKRCRDVNHDRYRLRTIVRTTRKRTTTFFGVRSKRVKSSSFILEIGFSNIVQMCMTIFEIDIRFIGFKLKHFARDVGENGFSAIKIKRSQTSLVRHYYISLQRWRLNISRDSAEDGFDSSFCTFSPIWTSFEKAELTRQDVWRFSDSISIVGVDVRPSMWYNRQTRRDADRRRRSAREFVSVRTDRATGSVGEMEIEPNNTSLSARNDTSNSGKANKYQVLVVNTS